MGKLHSSLESIHIRARAAWRLMRAVVHLLVGFLTILFRFQKLSPELRQIRIRVWSQHLLKHLGVRLEVCGNAQISGPLLLVANHISWLDISALHAARFCRFVSKSDVRAWPLIGALAAGVGSLFIQRESRKDAMRVVHHMGERLVAGDVLAIFPEGTTSDGVKLLPFHANLLQAAISVNSPVQPVAIEFFDSATGQRSLAPCYVGEDTLASSVWRTLKASGIHVKISFGEVQTADGRDRRAWAKDLRSQIENLRTPT